MQIYEQLCVKSIFIKIIYDFFAISTCIVVVEGREYDFAKVPCLNANVHGCFRDIFIERVRYLVRSCYKLYRIYLNESI